MRATGAALVVVVLVAAGCGSDAKTTVSSSRSSTTTSSTKPLAGPGDTAIWPYVSSSTRYTDPVTAAKEFAVTYLGFVNPVIGTFRQGDNRSGEVTVQPTSSGPVTTVLVRKLGSDETWWVLAASTPSLQLQSPTAMASITSPVTLSGRSTAFEGTVSVEVRQDGAVTPVATNFVTGGANGEMGPFSKAISFSKPIAASGAVVLKNAGGEQGSTWEASVIRVRFS